eukprot:8024824-Pyramimonas_sp.AAC.1
MALEDHGGERTPEAPRAGGGGPRTRGRRGPHPQDQGPPKPPQDPLAHRGSRPVKTRMLVGIETDGGESPSSPAPNNRPRGASNPNENRARKNAGSSKSCRQLARQIAVHLLVSDGFTWPRDETARLAGTGHGKGDPSAAASISMTRCASTRWPNSITLSGRLLICCWSLGTPRGQQVVAGRAVAQHVQRGLRLQPQQLGRLVEGVADLRDVEVPQRRAARTGELEGRPERPPVRLIQGHALVGDPCLPRPPVLARVEHQPPLAVALACQRVRRHQRIASKAKGLRGAEVRREGEKHEHREGQLAERDHRAHDRHHGRPRDRQPHAGRFQLLPAVQRPARPRQRGAGGAQRWQQVSQRRQRCPPRRRVEAV